LRPVGASDFSRLVIARDFLSLAPHLPATPRSLTQPSQAGTSPGEKFNIEHEGRFFEVVVPPGSQPGETLTIVGVASSASPFNTIKDLQDAAVTKALALNEYFKIQERAAVAQSTVLSKVSEIDAKYEISKMPLVVSGTTLAKTYLDLALAKAKELDSNYKIVAKAKELSDRVVVFAMEIDAKYCISATAARLILSSSNAVVQTYATTQERAKQSFSAVKESATKTVESVQERSKPAVEFVTKKSELVIDYVSKTKSQYFPAAIAAK